MQLTKNFQLSEFASHDGAPTPPKVLENLKELAANLQVLRDYLQTSITITSGYRSPAHNKAIGGAKFSQHMEGRAADIKTNKYTPAQVHAAIIHLIETKKMKQGGVGIYNSWIHYDTRGTEARWDETK
jgi:uncharacterized protein YcbK (DUF882 family)